MFTNISNWKDPPKHCIDLIAKMRKDFTDASKNHYSYWQKTLILFDLSPEGGSLSKNDMQWAKAELARRAEKIVYVVHKLWLNRNIIIDSFPLYVDATFSLEYQTKICSLGRCRLWREFAWIQRRSKLLWKTDSINSVRWSNNKQKSWRQWKRFLTLNNNMTATLRWLKWGHLWYKICRG